MVFSFEDCRLRATGRIAVDQIVDDLLGDQPPIEYNQAGDDIADSRKWEACGPPVSATRERVVSFTSASGARKAKSARSR